MWALTVHEQTAPEQLTPKQAPEQTVDEIMYQAIGMSSEEGEGEEEHQGQ
jgi:hypothetical protein